MDEVNSTRLSSRLHRILSIPGHSYGGAHIRAAENVFSLANPSGNIPIAIAENKLVMDIMIEKINSLSYPAHVMNYTSSSGLPELKVVLSNFLSQRVFEVPGEVVSPAQLTISAGCVALLAQLSYLLFEPGDSLLVPAPYYPAFDKDFLTFGEAQPVEVYLQEGIVSFGLTEDCLSEAFIRSLAQGKKPKALLLTHPCNPTGTMYTAAELSLAARWCKEFGIHLLCDEVYALSVHSTDTDDKFQSIVSVLGGDLGDHVHVMWSMSKDFGGSGLRLGVLYTQNNKLQQGMQATSDMFQVSNVMQSAVCQILSDDTFVDNYLHTCRSRIRDAYVTVITELKNIRTQGCPEGLPLAMVATAGIFVFVDLRSLLLEQTFAGESVLNDALVHKGVVMTPGSSCHANVPGYFRLCFAWVSREALVEGIRRIGVYAHEIGVALP